MVEEIRRKSRRMLGFDPETGVTTPSSPHNLSSEGQMKEDMHSEVESLPPFDPQVGGVVKTLEQGYLQPFTPPLTNMNSQVIVEVPTQKYTLSHQRYTPQTEELTLESLGLPSTSQNAPFSMAILTMINTQHVGLPANYKTLADTIGFDQPFSNLIQFDRLDLNSIPNTLPHSISLPNIPAPLTLLTPTDLNQHGTYQVPTPSSNVRNRVVTQAA
jgi:hypothetical protein